MTRCWRLVRLFIALLFVTNVACTPIVYVQPTGTMSFQQLLEADATLDARLAAHTMRGGVGVEPPELFANAGFEFGVDFMVNGEITFPKYAFFWCECLRVEPFFALDDEGFEYRNSSIEFAVELAASDVDPGKRAFLQVIGKPPFDQLFPNGRANVVGLSPAAGVAE